MPKDKDKRPTDSEGNELYDANFNPIDDSDLYANPDMDLWDWRGKKYEGDVYDSSGRLFRRGRTRHWYRLEESWSRSRDSEGWEILAVLITIAVIASLLILFWVAKNILNPGGLVGKTRNAYKRGDRERGDLYLQLYVIYLGAVAGVVTIVAGNMGHVSFASPIELFLLGPLIVLGGFFALAFLASLVGLVDLDF